jgi:hypothetical protein
MVYFAPLLAFSISVFSSKNFHVESELIRVIVGMNDQMGRVRDLIATICVPILALFSIKLDRAAAFDAESLGLAFMFLFTAIVSIVLYGICKASSARIADYGKTYPNILLTLLENYSRGTLIYFAVMLGVSVGPAVHGS